MNTTNTDADRKVKAAIINLKAALCTLRLVNAEVDAACWLKTMAALKTLVAGGVVTGEISKTILAQMPETLPQRLLRRDRGLWDVSVYFLLDQSIFFISVSDANVVELRAEIDGQDLRGESYGEYGEVDRTFAQFREAIEQNRTDDIGKKTYLGFWVARGYDTMQRVAQIRMLHQKHGAAFAPPLLIATEGNFIPADVAFPFLTQVERVAEQKKWRRTLPVDIGIAECLKQEFPHQNSYHKEIMGFLRSFSQERAPDRAEEFTLFVSFEAEKRQMINQEDFFSGLIGRIRPLVQKMRVLVNGMTGNVEGVDQFEDIRDFERQIIERLSASHPDVIFEHLHGQTLLDKARITSTADFFVAPLGTAALLPQVLNVPGVVYNSPEMMRQIQWFLDAMPSRAKLLPMELSQSIDGDMAMRKYKWGWVGQTRLSYELDIEKSLDFCMSLLRPDYVE